MQTTYTVTINDGMCTNTDDVIVSLYSLPNVIANINPSATLCAGDSVVLYGTGALSYIWDNNVIDSVLFEPVLTDYNVIGTDVNGCKNTASISLTINPLPVFDSILISDVTVCSIPYNGTVEVFPNGNEYSYDNSLFVNNNYIDTLTVGSHSIIIKDINGCECDTTILVGSNNGLVIDSVVSVPILCYNDSTSLIIYDTDAVQYSIDNGATYQTDSNFTVSAGVYSIIIIDGGGCSALLNDTVNQPDSININLNSTDVSCLNTGSVTAIVGGGTGSLTYLWSNDSTSLFIDNLTSGTYIITVTDENNCTASASVQVSEGNLLGEIIATVNNINCYADSTGSINVGLISGNQPFTYSWNHTSDNTDEVTNLPAGVYTVTVTDGFGCTADTSITLTQNAKLLISAEVNNINCFEDNNGSINLDITGGTSPYNINWGNGNITTVDSIIGLSADTFNIIVSDSYLCSYDTTIVITQPTDFNIEDNIKNIECNGYNSGEIELLITGATAPYTFNWSSVNSSNDSIYNLSAGVYTISIIDNNNCTISESFTITEPESLENISNITYENNSGRISIETTGGTPDYTYNWSNSANTNTVNDLIGGNYSVTVIDANNCADTLFFSIEDMNPIIIPTVFTPNGDGKNDTWNIQNIETIENIDIYIYNRWGDSVFSKSCSGIEYSNKSLQWNGNFNGKELPLGTYVYIVVVNKTDEHKGTVTIIR